MYELNQLQIKRQNKSLNKEINRLLRRIVNEVNENQLQMPKIARIKQHIKREIKK